MKTRFITTVAVLILFSLASCGSNPDNGLKIEIDNITKEEYNAPDLSFFNLEVSTKDLEIDNYHLIKLKQAYAIDNKGDTLNNIPDTFDDHFKQYNDISIKLPTANITAKKFKKLDGILYYFNPTKENNSLIVLNKPLEKYQTNILKGKSDDLKLFLVNLKYLEKVKLENEVEYKKFFKLFKEEGFFGEHNSVSLERNLFDSGNDDKNGKAINFFAAGNIGKIVEIRVHNEEGQDMSSGYNFGGNNRIGQYSINLSEPIQDNWTIEILLENEESIKELKFILNDIILP